MADRRVVVSELLTFLSNHYGYIENIEIISIFVDFHTSEEISQAKEILFKDIELLNLEKWDKPVRHRESDIKTLARKEAGDLVTNWSILTDKNVVNTTLPIYVAKTLSKLPPNPKDDSEFKMLWNKMKKFKSEI